MFMKIKISFIAFIYIMGGLFMVLFPPKRFPASIKKVPKVREVNVSHVFMEPMESDKVDRNAQTMADRNPDLVKSWVVGTTLENKSIRALEIKTDEEVKKKGILVIGGLNPMAWASSNAVLELAQQLVYSPAHQTPFLEQYDWYLLPLVNPEGYDFTLTWRDLPVSADAVWHRNMSGAKSRPAAWEKNLANEQDPDPDGCFGTNIDRNFPYHWQDEGDAHAAQAPCSQHYSGRTPFSAAETRTIRRYTDKLTGSIDLAVVLAATFHMNEESIVYPWHYSERRPSNWQKLQSIGEGAAREARLPSGRLFEVHQSSSHSEVGGTLQDYLMGVTGTRLVYIVRPYHEQMPNSTNFRPLEEYVKEALSATLGLIRAWRTTEGDNSIFFGKEKSDSTT